MKKGFLFLIVLLVSSLAQSALPPKAQEYLNQVPERKLTLPFVIKVALEQAESFRVIGLQSATAQLEEMGQIDSITDTVLTASGDYSDDNSAKTNGFQALRSKRWEYNLGLQKKWSTGTTTSLGWVYDTNSAEFANTGGLNNLFITEFKQSTAVLQLEQNLLRDSFGTAFRSKRLGARQRGKAIQWKAREDIENLTLETALQFYNAWLTQQQVGSIADQVKRQKRLVRILKRRSRKGAVEKPDLIQIEALLASNKTRFDLSQAALTKQWETLVINLKMPTEFLSVNAREIPLMIDNPVPLGLRVCGLKEPKKTAQIASLEKSMEALDADFRASKNDSLPDLKLVAGYRGNSIDQSASETVTNVLRGRDDQGFGRGPAWNVGLKLIWPLNNSGARALRAKKYIEKEQTAAQLRSAVDTLKVEWRDLCRRLKVEWNNDKIFKNVVLEQKKRVKAEERRFSLGRSSVNQLVTAEDDLGSWEYNSQQKSIEVRQLAWQVQKYSGELYKKISPAVDKLQSGESL